MSSTKELFEQYSTDINKHNFDLIEPLLSENCRFWFSNGTHEGIKETRKAFEKTWSLIKDEVYTISEIDWIAEGERSATCTYTYTWKGLINGFLKEGKGRGTSCFKKIGEQWRIVYEHLSSFPE